MENNALQHHGVKGQKWGVRRTPAQLGHRTSKTKKTTKTKTSLFGLKKKKTVKKQATEEPKKKTAKEMSDAELREQINRLKLEEEYKRLNPQQVSKGKKFMERVTNNILLPAAEDTAKQLAKSWMTKVVNDTFKLDDDLKIYTNNKKK